MIPRRNGRFRNGLLTTRVEPPPIALEPSILSPLVSGFFYRWFLPALFLVAAVPKFVHAIPHGSLGIDAVDRSQAAAACAAGSDPWEAYAVNEFSGNTYHFSALPPMVVVAVPSRVLPQQLAIATVIVLAAVASVFVVRQLRLPWYWLLFPPIVEGVLSGNPSLPVLALLLSRLAFMAPLLKIYAFVPITVSPGGGKS